ncbi:MAG: type II toxin-antitoxin system RelE/ParE family toxin [Verrucomicrobiota bacterium]
MKIEILPSAIADLEDGKQFYDAQEPGVGDYFQDCLFSDIESLVLYGGIHRVVFGFHRLLSKRFPYAIYYRVTDGEVAVVWRVLDCRRDPKRIRKFLGH